MSSALRSRDKRVLLENIEWELVAGYGRMLPNSVNFSLEFSEHAYILKTLDHMQWHRSRVADLLGIPMPTLRSKT